jgi:hypothetical protein
MQPAYLLLSFSEGSTTHQRSAAGSPPVILRTEEARAYGMKLRLQILME